MKNSITKSKTTKTKQIFTIAGENTLRMTRKKQENLRSHFLHENDVLMRLRKLVTQAQTIAPRELMQSGGRDRTSPPLCKI